MDSLATLDEDRLDFSPGPPLARSIGGHTRGRPSLRGELRRSAKRPSDCACVPRSIYDRIILRGITGGVWMEPSCTVEEVLRDQARVYHTQDRRGQVVLVLGAGNASCLVPGDFLYKLFVEDQVVLLRLNPVNAYLGPLIEEGFSFEIKCSSSHSLKMANM